MIDSHTSLISVASPPDLTTIDILPFIADSVICTDENGRILLFNPAAERSFGYSASEVIGNDIGILLPSRYRADHRDQVQAFGLGLGDSNRLMGHQREVWGLRKNGEEFVGEATISRHPLNGRTILTVVHRDITERKELEEQREAVAHELDHRIKNVISVVSALVSLTAKGATSVADFSDSLQTRLRALAATQSFLAKGKGVGADLDALLCAELAQYRAPDGVNLHIEGPTIQLRASAVQPLALAIHELATNSAKYGAFSEPGGRVTIVTDIASASGSRQLAIEWQEAGGPTTRPPHRHGFGTLLIQQMVERVFKGSVLFDYRPEGLVCRIEVPADRWEEASSKKVMTPN
ncbi:MAG: sensor histidine kinase [Tsuneonella sp.]